MDKTKRILGFTALMIATFLGTLDSTIVNIAIPTITSYFKSSLDDTSWISTIYVLSLSVFMITASKIADQFGRKKLLIIGLSIFGLSSFLCAMANSLLFLIIIRFVQGIGAAIITPIGLPMGLEILGKEKRQFVVAVAGAIISVAAASGPPLGGALVQYWGWQSIFYVNVPLCLIAIVLTGFFVRESYDTTSSKSIDWLGMLLLTVSLFLLTFALLKGGTFGWSSILIISMFIGSAVALGFFVFAECKTQNPMIELHLFKESTFTASCICYMMVGFGITSTMLIFNYFLENFLGYLALQAAMIIIFISITSAVSVPTGSVLAKRFGTRPINLLGVLLMGIGVFMLSRMNISTTKIEMIIALVVFGIGLGFAGQAIASAIKFIPQEKSGIASGIINAFRQVGTCIGVAVLVSLLTANVTKAISDIKVDAIAEINKESTITEPMKSKLIGKVETINGASNYTRDDIQTMVQNEFKSQLNSLSNGQQAIAVAKINEEKTTVINVFDFVIADKNDKVASAFDRTFLFSSIVLVVMSIFGIFTDRKEHLSKNE